MVDPGHTVQFMSLSAFLGMSHCSPGGAGGSGQGETGLASLFRLLPHDQTLDEQKKIDGQMDRWMDQACGPETSAGSCAVSVFQQIFLVLLESLGLCIVQAYSTGADRIWIPHVESSAPLALKRSEQCSCSADVMFSVVAFRSD